MKNKMNRSHISTRTVALVMSVIMLIGSVATGSMLSTFAAYLKDAANSDAVSQAATEGGNIALNAIPGQDDADSKAAEADNANGANLTDGTADAAQAPDLPGFEENEIVKGLKKDLAVTGAKADVASTGATTITNMTYAMLYGQFNTTDGSWSSSWSSTYMTKDDSNHYHIITWLKANTKYEFKVIAGGNGWENKYALNSSTGFTYDTSNTRYTDLGVQNSSGYNFGLQTKACATGYVKVRFDFYGSYGISNVNHSLLDISQSDVTRVSIPGAFNGWNENTEFKYTVDSFTSEGYYKYSVDNITAYNSTSYSNSASTRFAVCDYGTWTRHYASDQGAWNLTTDTSSVVMNITHTSSDSGCFYFKLPLASNLTFYLYPSSASTDYELKINGVAVPSDTYTITGAYGTSESSTAGLFTDAWDPTETTNDLSYQVGGLYEKTYTVTSADAGTIYFKVVKNHDWDEGSWPSANQTFKIQSDSTWVKFSFDPDTHTITVTQDGTGGGSSSSGDWIAGDKYTSSGTQNSSQQVANTPSIGSTAAYSYVWADNDNGPGTAGTTAIATYANGTSGTIGYWADVTEQLTTCKDANKNFFFALANVAPASNPSNANIRGNKEEKINCVIPSGGSTTSSGSSVNMYASDGTKVLEVGRQERSNISSSAYYIKITYFDKEKISNVGVMAYYSGSGAVDYQFYFKEKDSGGDTETVEKVNIYAKNGALRDSTFNRFTNLADTKIYGEANSYQETGVFEYTEVTGSGVVTYNTIKAYNDAHTGSEIAIEHDVIDYNSNYDKITNVPVGAKIKLETTLSNDATADGSFNSTAFRETHYMKAYSFNGKTYQVNDWSDTGVYSETWTVESVNTSKMKSESGNKVIEVTPIYYMKDTTNVKTFYIDGYDGTVQGQWGNMLSVYPYYEGISNKANAFGGYPGQPMLFWGGKYQMQIPLTVDGTASGATVKGLTLHNAYWDLLHRDLDTQCSTRGHAQTYDYDDFYKLNKEKNPDTIIFDFKYTTDIDNYGDGYQYTNYTFADDTTFDADDYNDLEILTDYFGRQVDVFGNLITDTNKTSYDPTAASPTFDGDELRIVSTGYKDTYVGEYATLWAVYAPSSTVPSSSGDTANGFIGYISSSMLYLSSLDRRSQYTGGTNTANGRMGWSEFVDTYTQLKTYYTGVPALISYDEEIWNDSKDKANRSDGRWYYSNKNDQISANIKIQYGPASNLNASVDAGSWTDDPFDVTTESPAHTGAKGVGGEENIGTTTLCSAFFTNTSPYLYGKTESGTQFADSTKKFTFEAQANGAYMFAGWVRYSNGKYYEITSSELGESDMSSNDTYIARFVEAETGSLTIQHVVEKTATYTGSGKPSLTVLVRNGSTEVVNKTVTDGSKIDISSYINTRYRGYTIDISLSTTPDADCTLKEITSSIGQFSAGTITSNAATVAQFTVQDVIDSGATTLRYVSHLTMATFTYEYNITYSYTSRFWGEQRYTVSGSLSSSSSKDMTNITGSKTSAKLKTDFLYNHTPYEKNFRKKIAWNHDGATQSSVLKSGTTYTITAAVGSTNTVDDSIKAEFMLPYQYDTKANGYKAKPIDVYDSSGNKTEDTEYVYDDKSYESVPLTAQAYKLFTYDGSSATGGTGTHASYMPLIEAAPYVYKNVTMHQNTTNTKKRYLNANFVTENDTKYYYFTYNSVRYFYNELPPTHESTDEVLTASNTYTFQGITYDYALNPSTVTGGTTTYADNDDNNEERGAVYYWDRGEAAKGQYCVTHYHYINDGVVANTGEKKYFTRWDIYNSKGNYVASSYLRYFNYSGYENYIVIPKYESDTETVTAGSETGANKVPTITWLGDGRNQWNNSGYGSYTGWTQGDKLLTDFAISFDYYGEKISEIPAYSSSVEGSKNIRIGMMIEQLGELDTAGGKTITDSSYYADKYKSSYTSDTITGIQNALASGTNPSSVTGTGSKIVNSKIASNVSGWGKLFTDTTGNLGNGQTGLAPIDNMNRLQWYYTFNNLTKAGAATTDKDYIYRASAYIIEDQGGDKTVTLSTTPVYFTIYDIASRQLGELS